MAMLALAPVCFLGTLVATEVQARENYALIGAARADTRRVVYADADADGWGDPTAWMLEALPVFEDHGHDEIAAACRSLLRRAGAPVPRRGKALSIPSDLRSLGVTAREAQVLTLLAEGLPNREIAERLYLSPRTVERHIANLTVKAGVRGRSELIAFAARAT